MAFSYVEYTSNSGANSGKDYTYSFGAVEHDTDNIKVTIGGTTLTTSQYSVVEGTVTLTTVPGAGSAPFDAALSASNILRVFRETNRTTAEVVFSANAVIQDEDLNTATDQGRFLALEAVDRANESISIDPTDLSQYDIKVSGATKRISGLSTPDDDDDAATKAYADSTVNSAKSIRDDALDHKDTAADYATRIDAVVRVFDGATDNTSDTSPADQAGVYSSKEWAVGKVAGNSDGSSKQWALGGGATFDSGTAVSGSSFSAKEYAQGDVTSHGGSAKAWATDASSPDGSSEKSAKTLAGEASTSATEASASATAAAASAAAVATALDSFDDKYLGVMADNASAVDVELAGASCAEGASSITFTGITSGSVVIGQELTSTGTGYPSSANIIGTSTTSPITISAPFTTAISGVALTFEGQGVYGAWDAAKDGPSTDNDGNALVNGALYYNSTDGEMRVYDTTSGAWIAASAAQNATVLDYTYTLSGSDATISGDDDNSATLSFSSQESVDVFLNGVKLVPKIGSDANDYHLDTSNTVTLTSTAVSGDVILVRVYKTFTVADAVPASTGGTFSGNVAYTGNIQVDDIVEKTSAHGVEIDGLKVKDSAIVTSSNKYSALKTGEANSLGYIEKAFVGATYYLSTNHDINPNTYTHIDANFNKMTNGVNGTTIGSTDADPFAQFTSGTFTPKVAGYWLCTFSYRIASVGDTNIAWAFLMKNWTSGGPVSGSFFGVRLYGSATQQPAGSGAGILPLGTSDTVKLIGYYDGGGVPVFSEGHTNVGFYYLGKNAI